MGIVSSLGRMWRFALLGLLAGPAAAVELRQIEFKVGIEGLSAAPLTLRNAGDESISCTAELAHWYSQSVGEAAPGGEAKIELWFEPATGAYVLLNAKRENMPVESLWCGIAGRAYATRSIIVLQRSKGGASTAREVSCAVLEDRLRCE
jgi:hypothetical protein